MSRLFDLGKKAAPAVGHAVRAAAPKIAKKGIEVAPKVAASAVEHAPELAAFALANAKVAANAGKDKSIQLASRGGAKAAGVLGVAARSAKDGLSAAGSTAWRGFRAMPAKSKAGVVGAVALLAGAGVAHVVYHSRKAATADDTYEVATVGGDAAENAE